MHKTSQTHPLRFDFVPAANGQIGMIFCPGKKQSGAICGHWHRDLETDLEAIKAWGATTVVSLVEAFELEFLQVPDLGECVQASGMVWMHLPIVDMHVPDKAFENLWQIAGLALRQRLRRGEKILLHCMGGLGRTGMIAAQLLVELGTDSGVAINLVRQARPGTIQTISQEAYVHACQAIPTQQDLQADRQWGCLIGGMLGDAIGYPVEFKKSPNWYGVSGAASLRSITEQAALACSDDSQMTLATLYGIRRSHGSQKVVECVKDAYLAWFAGQVDQPVPCEWMAQFPDMLANRASGTTCIQSLARLWEGKPLEFNDRKGAGALMRVAPLAMMHLPLLVRQDLADEVGAITHHHPTSRQACRIWVILLDALLRGFDLPTAIQAVRKDPVCQHLTMDLRDALHKAEMLWLTKVAYGVGLIGEGWVAEEALAIAVYAALTAESLQHLLTLSVCHDGDSDTTGSLAMQLYGARHGLSGLPWHWVVKLDLLPALLAMPHDQADLARDDAGMLASSGSY